MGERNTKRRIAEALFIFIMLALPLLLFHIYLSGNSLTGNAVVSSRAFIYMKYNAVCLTTLHQGWNLASFACEVDNSSVNSILNMSRVISIHGYYENDTSDPWKAYMAGLPSWVIQDLNEISPDEGYWVKVNESMEVLEYGNLTLPKLIPLVRGWNLKGFPNNQTESAEDVFGSTANIEGVWAYEATDEGDHWKVYSPSNPGGSDLKNITPGSGYWIKTTNESEWMVN